MQPTRQNTEFSEKIIAAACRHYNCTETDLHKKDFIENKKIIFYLLREHACMKYIKIAKRFNYFDHAWTLRMIQEISHNQKIYEHISHDIKSIMQIVSTLV
jgi:chromosomal replication initiation ATPase DnaA